jgi:hypothetical protein
MGFYYPVPTPFFQVTTAAGFTGGDNPPYIVSDFTDFYPQFIGNVDSQLIENYIGVANGIVSQSTWGSQWKFGMALVIAHFLTLYLQAGGGCNPTTASITAGGGVKGQVASKSVDGLSFSYDYGNTASGLDGWANWKSTSFGLQFATLARMYGKSGLYIW